MKPVTVKPLGPRVLSRLLPPDPLSRIILTPMSKNEDRPSSSSYLPKPAVVIAVGPGFENEATGEITPITSIKPGDEILLPIYPGIAVPEYGMSESGEIVEIRDSRSSGLMVTNFSEIVGKRVRE